MDETLCESRSVGYICLLTYLILRTIIILWKSYVHNWPIKVKEGKIFSKFQWQIYLNIFFHTG